MAIPDVGITTVCKAEHLENEYAAINVSDVGKTRFDMAVPVNAPRAMDTMEVGKTMSRRDEQPRNESLPIFRIDVGMFTFLKKGQNLNAPDSIAVIVVGMDTDIRLHLPPQVELAKELFAMIVRVVGILIVTVSLKHSCLDLSLIHI